MGGSSAKETPMGFGGQMPKSPRSQGPPPQWLQQAHNDVTKPLNLAMPVQYGARHGEEGHMGLRRRQQNKSHVFFERWRINGPTIVKAMIAVLVPPVVFFWTTCILSFEWHFKYPKRVWPIAFLAIIPTFVGIYFGLRNWRMGLDWRWSVGATSLFFLAFCAGMLLGDMNYLVNLHHYYFINSLKSYSNIKPADVSGTQLMDAGRVQFADGTRLLIDMGMSFTMWDTYCVAPLGQAQGGPTLASYDLWAVGKNCCRTSNPTFACGEYQNINARSGLRQTNEAERLYYALAVQQAEAAYGIEAKHPIFFHWVEDPDSDMQNYFNMGFRSFIFSLFCHMVLNSFAVFCFVNIFKYSQRALFADPIVPGSYMLAHAPPPAHGHEHH
jgi:hypothetical protein